MAEEKLVKLSDVEFYLRRTAKNMIDEAEKDAETLTEGEREQIGACVLALRELANNAHRLPTVDAEPVVHGRNLKLDTPSLFECSICKWSCWDTLCGDTEVWRYCPNCGARMDAKEDATCG